MRRTVLLFGSLFISVASLPAQTNFGTLSVGSNSSITVTVSFIQAGTLTNIQVTTGAEPQLDFTSSNGSCKVGSVYTATSTCTVNVTFAPTLAGPRFGAIVLSDPSGAVLGQQYLWGTGQAPQISFSPASQTQLLGNANSYFAPNGLATDPGGNVYGVIGAFQQQADGGSPVYGSVLRIPGNINADGIEANFPTDLSVDGAGNTYIADAITGVSIPTPSGIYGWSHIPTSSFGFADADGNLYKSCTAGLCKETPVSGGTYTESTIGAISPSLLFVDGTGDVYAITYLGGTATIDKFTPSGSSYVQTTVVSGLSQVNALAADPLGNVYFSDSSTSVYKEVLQADGSYVQNLLFTGAVTQYIVNFADNVEGSASANRLAVDPAGNLYFWKKTGTVTSISSNPNRPSTQVPVYGLFEAEYSLPSTLTFPQTPQYAASATQTVTITNVGNLPLQFSAVVFPADFKETSSGGAECTAVTSLDSNQSCTLTVAFSPVANMSGTSSSISEQLVITTNLHNVPGTLQAITLSGTETPSTKPIFSFSPASLDFPAIFPNTTSAPVTLTVSNMSALAASVSSYKLTGPNASDFEMVGKTCGYSLAAHSSCTLNYVFKPTVSGSETAILVATDNANGSPQSIPVSGIASPPATIAFSTGLTFGPTKAGSTSAAQNITVSNVSSVPMEINSFSFAGPSASEFIIASKTCNPYLAANSSCVVAVAFRPSQPGPATATLVTIAYANGSPGAVNLSGTGQ